MNAESKERGKEWKRREKRNIERDKRISVSFVNSVTRMTDMMAIYPF